MKDPRFQDPNCLEPDFSDWRDLFIHGMIGGPGVTCASMPVLYAAVGRRLNYPLKLVEAKGHLFVRWDDPHGKFWSPGARFNIEATCQGLGCYPDEHYMHWPVTMTEKELAHGCYLQPLTPEQEVAMFRSTRGICLWENQRYAEAMREFHWATVFAAGDERYVHQILEQYKKYRQIMATKSPAELAKLAMPLEEEIQLQKNIVLGHHESLRRGHRGYNLADYGIFPKALAESRPLPIDPMARPGNLAALDVNWSPSMSAGEMQARLDRVRHLGGQRHV